MHCVGVGTGHPARHQCRHRAPRGLLPRRCRCPAGQPAIGDGVAAPRHFPHRRPRTRRGRGGPWRAQGRRRRGAALGGGGRRPPPGALCPPVSAAARGGATIAPQPWLRGCRSTAGRTAARQRERRAKRRLAHQPRPAEAGGAAAAAAERGRLPRDGAHRAQMAAEGRRRHADTPCRPPRPPRGSARSRRPRRRRQAS